jgi:hypothetical protein
VNTQLEYEVQAGYNGWTGILVDFGVGKSALSHFLDSALMFIASGN